MREVEKKVEAKKYYTSHAAHWVIKFRRDCLYLMVVWVVDFQGKGTKLERFFGQNSIVQRKLFYLVN